MKKCRAVSAVGVNGAVRVRDKKKRKSGWGPFIAHSSGVKPEMFVFLAKRGEWGDVNGGRVRWPGLVNKIIESAKK